MTAVESATAVKGMDGWVSNFSNLEILLEVSPRRADSDEFSRFKAAMISFSKTPRRSDRRRCKPLFWIPRQRGFHQISKLALGAALFRQ